MNNEQSLPVIEADRVPVEVAARQLMGLYYELAGMPDMAADVRADEWEAGSGFGPGSERELLAVMAALVTTVRKEEAAHRTEATAKLEAENEDMANVGRSLMEAIEKDFAGHPFMKHWHPCDCPTEIVGDLLNANDEHEARITTLEADLKVAREALRIFVGCAYPVALEINARGYNWSEAYLDQAWLIAHVAPPSAGAEGS